MVLVCDLLRLGTFLLLVPTSQGTASVVNRSGSDVDSTDEIFLLMDTIIRNFMPQCLRVQMDFVSNTSHTNANEYSRNIRSIWPTLTSLTYNTSPVSETHPFILIDQSNVKSTENIANFINKNTAKATPTGCVTYKSYRPPNLQLLPSLAHSSYGKGLTRYFLVHTQNSTEAEQFLLDHRLGKEENVAALVQEEGHNSSYWRVLIRQLLHPSGSPQVLTVNRWSRDTGLTSTENIFPEQMENFNGKKLIVSTLQFIPFIAIAQSEGLLIKELNPCIDGLILNMIAQKLNFTYQLIMPKDKNWGGRKKDGHYHGIVGEVETGRANFSLLLSRTEERAQVVDFTRLYLQDPLTFITAKSKPTFSWRKLYAPFQTIVWVCVLVSVGGGSLLYHVIYHTQATLTSSRLLSSQAFMHVLASFLNQSVSHYAWLQSGRVFLGFWLLCSFLVTCHYTTSLTSTLAVPFAPPALNTLQQLYQSDYQYGMKPKTSQHQYFSSSDNELYQKMIKRMSFYSDDESLQIAKEANYAFISFKSYLSFQVSLHNSNPDRKHDLRVATEEFYPGGFAWALPKGAPYRKGFDDVMLRISEAGLIPKWFRDLTPYYVREGKKQKPDDELIKNEEVVVPKISGLVVFSLGHLQGPFFMLLLGYMLGVLVLAVEWIMAK